MTQDLFYTPASSSLVLIRSTEPSPYYWYNVTSLTISGSGYDAPVSGTEFIGTVGTARIYAYSGSVELVSFPLEETNLFYPPFPNPLTIESYYQQPILTSSFSIVNWNFIIEGIFTPGELSGSIASIYDLSTSSSYLSYSLESSNGSFPIISGNTLLFSISGSGSYDSYLYINDITSGSNLIILSASNAYISASYTLQNFHDYSVTFSIISTYSP